MLQTDLILLAAGSGSRFNSDERANPLPKQFLSISGRPLYEHSLQKLIGLPPVRRCLLVIPPEMERFVLPDCSKPVVMLHGGTRRQDSVRIALEWISRRSPLPERVLIHDACRPNLSEALMGRIAFYLSDTSRSAWVPVEPVTDTLKRVRDGKILSTVDRSDLYRSQTPQIFNFDLLRKLALKAWEEDRFSSFTDEAALMEKYGVEVGVFEGDSRNLKLTYPHEQDILRAFLDL